MNTLIFDIFLELEYGDENHKLSDAIVESSTEIIRVGVAALSTAADYFNKEIKPHCHFKASKESIDIAEFLLQTSVFVTLNRT